MDHQAFVRKELLEVQSSKRKLEAILKIQRPEGLQETAAPVVSNKELERLIDQDPEVSALKAAVSDMESRLVSEKTNTGRVSRKSTMDPGVKRLKDELDSLRKQLASKRVAAKPAALRQLQDPEVNATPNFKGGTPAQQLALVEEMEERLKEEIEKNKKLESALTDNTLDLQDLQDELKQTQESADKIAREAEVLTVELQAPPRIKKLEDAVPPTSRDSKKWWIMFGMISLGSFLVPLVGVTFLELRTRKIDNADEVVIDLGLPVVGSLPMLPSKARRHGVVDRNEKDRYWYNLLLESIDATRTMLVHAARSGSHRVVLITSALSGEGKTSLASHLATSLARSGKKTLLIDADLRKPSIHRLFDLTAEPGLGELLRRENTLEEVTAATAISELKIITAGRCDHLTLRILSQGGMGGLFTGLKEQYDFVIVDSSPILPVADALIIAQQVDAVLFSVLTDVSRKTKVFAAYQRLATLGVKVLGAVVTGAHDGVYGTNYYPGDVTPTMPTALDSTETGATS